MSDRCSWWPKLVHRSRRSLVDVAECELAVLASQCLAWRLADMQTVRHKISAWEQQRNVERPTVKCHFTTAEARRKLKHLYPSTADSDTTRSN